MLGLLGLVGLVSGGVLPGCGGAGAAADAGADVTGDTGVGGDVQAGTEDTSTEDVFGGPHPPECVDPTERIVLPYPAWGAGDSFGPPPGDAAVAALSALRPQWAAQLAELRGWSAKPVALVPLRQPASSVDPSHIYVFGATEVGGSFTPLPDVPVEAELLGDGQTLAVGLRDPAPAWVAEVGFQVYATALGDVEPLPACGPDGEPMPASASAADTVAVEEASFVFPTFPLARTSRVLVQTWKREAAAPSLQVAEVQARAQADFGEAASPPDVAELLNPTIAWARLTLPEYRAGDHKHAAVGGDGGLAAAGTTEPGVLVVRPASGAPPFPWVLFQHGGGQDKADVLQLAGSLAQAGFALVALDLPYHGDRAKPGGGSDLDFLDFDDPLKTRDAFRQAAADQMAVVAGVGALNEALKPIFGGAETLDAGRAYYMGLSLGAVSGSLSFAAGRGYAGAALFVGGGYYPALLGGGVFSLFVQDINQQEPVERRASLLLLEALLDGADPVSYAQVAEDRSVPPRAALFFQAGGDPIIAQGASDGWARAFGADVAEPTTDPVHHEIPGMGLMPLPAAGNFVWPPEEPNQDLGGVSQGQAATRLLMECPMAGVAVSDRHAGLITEGYSQELVAHCFAGLAAGGPCEVIDTGFGAPE